MYLGRQPLLFPAMIKERSGEFWTRFNGTKHKPTTIVLQQLRRG